jgi:hypothetical protein
VWLGLKPSMFLVSAWHRHGRPAPSSLLFDLIA